MPNPEVANLTRTVWNALDIAKRASARLNCVAIVCAGKAIRLGRQHRGRRQTASVRCQAKSLSQLGEDLALTLGEFNGDVGIVCAPDDQCGQVQGAQRFGELTRSLFRIEGISIKP